MKNGRDAETGCYISDFICTRNKMFRDFEFEGNIQIIKQVQRYILKGYSLANESLDEISDLPARNCIDLYNVGASINVSTAYAGIPKTVSLKKAIKTVREYLEKNSIQLTPKQVIEYKKMGILPLHINQDGVDEETQKPKPLRWSLSHCPS